jgi:hypothetical protein
MSIKRYRATKDSTITNAFESNLSDRGTLANMGASDILEVFSIYGQATTSSTEACRALVYFPIDSIKSDRDSNAIPASGSVSFVLRVFNAKHGETLPKDFTLMVNPVSGTQNSNWSWQEGRGLDMEEYSDKMPVSWISASLTDDWLVTGGDFHTASYTAGTNLPHYTQYFDTGTENLEIDISELVEQWISGTLNPATDHVRRNHGLGIMLTGSQENSATTYFTKRFFARTSEFFYKRPIIEARWDSSKFDDYGNFYLSSSLASATDNLNTIYLYNSIRGQLKNIPGVDTGPVLVSAYSTLGGDKTTLPIGGGVIASGDTNVTGGYVEAGIYSASFAYTGSATTIYPVWFSGSTEYHTGSAITVKAFDSEDYNPNPKYVTTVSNLRSVYSDEEAARFRLTTRQKDWSPTIYTVAKSAMPNQIIDKAYYRVFRVVDNFEVINYGTGSSQHTLMSFDKEGNYFDLDMSMLERDYAYAFQFVYYVNGKYFEQPEIFKFRVE